MDNLSILKEDIQNAWNPKRFELSRSPYVIGIIEDTDSFSTTKASCLDMPIKLPRSELIIPEGYQSLLEVIGKCLDFEKKINDDWEQYYIYLTVDQRYVPRGKTQRRAGAHIDGMQGARYQTKIPICHSYIVSDRVPTRFYNHAFPTNLDENKQNWFKEFAKVADMSNSTTTKPYEINFMTAYNVHEATTASDDCVRTFVRIEFSLKQFDRIGNTVNPLIGKVFDYVDRSIPSHLA